MAPDTSSLFDYAPWHIVYLADFWQHGNHLLLWPHSFSFPPAITYWFTLLFLDSTASSNSWLLTSLNPATIIPILMTFTSVCWKLTFLLYYLPLSSSPYSKIIVLLLFPFSSNISKKSFLWSTTHFLQLHIWEQSIAVHFPLTVSHSAYSSGWQMRSNQGKRMHCNEIKAERGENRKTENKRVCV